MDELYNSKATQTKPSEAIDEHQTKPSEAIDGNKCEWEEIQDLTLEDNDDANKKIRRMVLAAQRRSVKLPIVRRAARAGFILDDNHKEVLRVEKDQIILCDIVSLHSASSLSAPIIRYCENAMLTSCPTPIAQSLCRARSFRRQSDHRCQIKRRLLNLRLRSERRLRAFQLPGHRSPWLDSHYQSPRPNEESPTWP